MGTKPIAPCSHFWKWGLPSIPPQLHIQVVNVQNIDSENVDSENVVSQNADFPIVNSQGVISSPFLGERQNNNPSMDQNRRL